MNCRTYYKAVLGLLIVGNVMSCGGFSKNEGNDTNKRLTADRADAISDVELLKSTEWIESNESLFKRWTYSFTDSLILDCTYYSHDSSKQTVWHLYYLTDKKPKRFDFTKIGKTASGHFLVRFYEGRWSYDEILELSNNRLVLQRSTDGDTIVFYRK